LSSRRTQVVAVGAVVALIALAGCKGNSGSTTGNGGGKTDPGITSTSITIGTVADQTGPVPGIFLGAIDGVKAYVEYINSLGGVNGRLLKDQTKDSALSCSQDQQGATALSASTFALVGSFALYDQCSIPLVKAHPTLPYVGLELNAQLAALPNVFNPQPIPAGFRTGAYSYIMQHYHVNKLGFLAGQGAQEIVEKAQESSAESVGAKLAYERFITPTETDFTSDVIRMRKAGVQWVNLSNLTSGDEAHFIQNANQQKWHPKVIEASTAYDGKFFGYFPNPAIANNVVIDQTFAMFLGEDAATTPGVKLFDTWMAKAAPSFKPDLYAMYGWTSTALFVQALKAAGKNPTRTSVIAQLKNIHSFTAGGMLAPADPGAKKPAMCWMLIRVENEKFIRTYPTGKGFACSPGGFHYTKS
jgi:ABC-type branched-subunit amino acid transport system substrate-binding protein